jgi:RNA polymerase sigma-70 factor (ECF subfamily)
VARHALSAGARFARLCQPALVDGAPAIIVPAPAGPLAVALLTIAGDRITGIDLILDPAMLRAFVVVDD